MRKIAVIGSGVMGAGIAAHAANAGAEVLLLDIVPEGAEDRSTLARGAIARMSNGRAPQLADPDFAMRLTPGNLEDDLENLSDCDWVVEVVLEDLAIKRGLYAKIAPHLSPDCVLSSNTSTIPLADLIAELHDDLRRRFCVTHFFNPPRQMRLIELVTGLDADTGAIDRVQEFCDHRLGKTVVPCNDRPGFIANRLGGFWMDIAAREAEERGITVEEADAVLSRPFGIPPTGVFGLTDLIGIDLMDRSRLSMHDLLEQDDPQQAAITDFTLFARMAEKGLTGRKAGAGFYRRGKAEDGSRTAEAVDLTTLEYRPQSKVEKLDKTFGTEFIDRKGDRLADFAWAVMGRTLTYAAWCVPEITENPADVDRAMELGYSWRAGPFKLIDKIGADKIAARLAEDGLPIPDLLAKAVERGGLYTENGRKVLLPDGQHGDIPRAPGVLLAADLEHKPVFATDEIALRDMGDGVALLSITTPNAALDDRVMASLSEAIDVVTRDFKALVVGSDGAHFSVGADLKKALTRADEGAIGLVAKQLTLGQATLRKMKYTPFPTVSAVSGLALGGGCEIALHSTAVAAHLEANLGLVEANVGLLPAWGGTTAILLRKTAELGDPVAGALAAFDVISAATLAGSAPMARKAAYLRDTDLIIMNRDRLLSEAKSLALSLAESYEPPKKAEILLDAGAISQAMEAKLAALSEATQDAPYTVEIARETAQVLAGGKGGRLGEEALHQLEADGMMRLIRNPKTLERMRHTMTTGKPLKN